MKVLRKVWVRFLIALVGGGMLSEIIFISTGDPNRPRPVNENRINILYMIAIYTVLTIAVRINKNNEFEK